MATHLQTTSEHQIDSISNDAVLAVNIPNDNDNTSKSDLPNDSNAGSPLSTIAVYGTPESQCTQIEFPSINKEHSLSKQTINDESDTMDHEQQRLNIHSPSASASISPCRYCYNDILRKSNVSQCHCNGKLCKDCLIKEVILTYNRSNHEPKCTVCQSTYNVDTEFAWKCDFKSCYKLCKFMEYFGLKNERHLLNQTGAKVGFILVILGIAVWILSTCLIFIFPTYGLPLFLYYLIGVFDLIVGVATLWFVIKCRWVITCSLSILYTLRCLFLLLGWVPKVALLSITQKQTVNINVVSYFVSFSFIASMILTVFWLMDILQQIEKFKRENKTLIVNGVAVNVDRMDRRGVNQENDQF